MLSVNPRSRVLAGAAEGEEMSERMVDEWVGIEDGGATLQGTP
jgi:hypothetical protein